MDRMNSGYRGWSMSNRAHDAYENGEKPKSKWTKAAMLERIEEHVSEHGEKKQIIATLGDMRKDELFDAFFMLSSRHHTSKYANLTDFYSLNEETVDTWVTVWFDIDESTRDQLFAAADEAKDTLNKLAENRTNRALASDRIYGSLASDVEYINQCEQYCAWWEAYGQAWKDRFNYAHTGGGLRVVLEHQAKEQGKGLGTPFELDGARVTVNAQSVEISVPPYGWNSCHAYVAVGAVIDASNREYANPLRRWEEKYNSRKEKISTFRAAMSAAHSNVDAINELEQLREAEAESDIAYSHAAAAFREMCKAHLGEEGNIAERLEAVRQLEPSPFAGIFGGDIIEALNQERTVADTPRERTPQETMRALQQTAFTRK